MRTRTPGCPAETTLAVIGGRWKPVIIYHLLKGSLRYSQLGQVIPEVTHQVLTHQLRELERDGILARKVYPVVPPRVQYRLTPLGKTLGPVLREMCAWAKTYGARSQSPAGVTALLPAGRRPVRSSA
jgi:DNA-binding HxlR family transcriptional regulator